MEPRLGQAGTASRGGSHSAAGASTSSGGNVSWTDDGHAEACWEYGQQVCGLLERCSGLAQPSCLQRWLLECPDELFSDGSTASVEGVQACAAQWSGWSCDELVAGRTPSCLTAGEKSLGESCAFASQCESGSCSAVNGCGECQARPAPGEPCTRDSCPVGQGCLAEVCETAPSLLPRAGVGEPCNPFKLCGPNTVCYSGVCSTQPQLGEPCVRDLGCADGYCDEGVCVPPAAVDESCRVIPCAKGLDCVSPRVGLRVCRPLPPNPECRDDSSCAPGDTCYFGTCVRVVEFGAPCDAGNICFELAVCVDGTCRARPAENTYANRCHLDQ